MEEIGLVTPIPGPCVPTILGLIVYIPGLILGLRPANERRRYKVTPSLIG